MGRLTNHLVHSLSTYFAEAMHLKLYEDI
ncbi:hypothetical protein SPHINGOAX6_70609 [Sphingomonas sp. AX6]|nr:hypothetical protein SPHINGOAX6_70609 [Sphingomonas sp. AX6]